MPPSDAISSLPMLQLAYELRLHELPSGPADETVVRRVEEYIDEYRAWAQSRDRAVVKHLLETPNAYRVTVPAGPGAFDLAARASWYFDEILVQDPLAPLLGENPLWQFTYSPPFQTKAPHEWIRMQRAVHVMNRLRKLQDLGELLASRTVILAGAPPNPLEASVPGESHHQPAASPSPETMKVAHEFADALSAVVNDAERARVLASRADFPLQHLLHFSYPNAFWHDVVNQALGGRCTLSTLAHRAADDYPANHGFRQFADIIDALDSTAPAGAAGSHYDHLVARVLSERPFLDWLRSHVDLGMIDTVPDGDTSRWQFRRAELNGIFRIGIRRDQPVGPGESVSFTLPRDQDFHPFDWRLNHPGVPPQFGDLLDALVRDYLGGLGSVGAGGIHLGTGILPKDRIERSLVRALLEGKGVSNTPGHLDVADSFHVATPMVEGLTPTQLLELREQLPLAFQDYRAKLATICRESQSIEEAQVSADAEFLPLVRELEGGLESLKARTRIAAGGAAIVTVVGGLATSFLDTALIPAAFLSGGSLMGLVHRYTHQKAEEKKLRSRAALFLWEARSKAGKRNS